MIRSISLSHIFKYLFSFRAENVRRYQQQLREQTHPSSAMQPQQTFKLPETVGWARQTSQSHEQTSQPMNFAEIQKQEQEQERRAREALLVAQQMVCHERFSSVFHLFHLFD